MRDDRDSQHPMFFAAHTEEPLAPGAYPRRATGKPKRRPEHPPRGDDRTSCAMIMVKSAHEFLNRQGSSAPS